MVGLAACACLIGQGAYGQDKASSSATSATEAASALTPEKKTLIKELLVLSDADKNVHTIIDTLLESQRKSYPVILQQVLNADQTLNDAQRKVILEHQEERRDHFTARMKELFDKNIDMAGVLDSVAYNVYNKYFTTDELKDIIAWYKTATGKKTLHVMPDLMKESMNETRILMTPKIEKSIVQLVQEEQQSLHAPPAVTK